MEWKKIKEEPIWNGYRKVARWFFERPDGKVADFEIALGGGVVCVLALTAERRVVLARQFRPGPQLVALELPGGRCEKGETPEESMRRELLEETGYEGDLRFVGTSLTDAYSQVIRHNFVATGCRRVREQHLDENELIEVVEMPLDKFRAHLRSGQLTDVTTGYLGLDFLGLL